jgi:hypothetical protein
LDIPGSISADVEFFPAQEWAGDFHLAIIVGRDPNEIREYFDLDHALEPINGIHTDRLTFEADGRMFGLCFGYAAKIKIFYPFPKIFESPPLAHDLHSAL